MSAPRKFLSSMSSIYNSLPSMRGLLSRTQPESKDPSECEITVQSTHASPSSLAKASNMSKLATVLTILASVSAKAARMSRQMVGEGENFDIGYDKTYLRDDTTGTEYLLESNIPFLSSTLRGICSGISTSFQKGVLFNPLFKDHCDLDSAHPEKEVLVSIEFSKKMSPYFSDCLDHFMENTCHPKPLPTPEMSEAEKIVGLCIIAGIFVTAGCCVVASVCKSRRESSYNSSFTTFTPDFRDPLLVEPVPLIAPCPSVAVAVIPAHDHCHDHYRSQSHHRDLVEAPSHHRDAVFGGPRM